ncbi:hypothetical protein DW766_15370 [Butyricicoccus sp. AM29-23AC]|nr:hypothetical protein DW766_15370 [Butyricicoccus sp. AM29-23AC]
MIGNGEMGRLAARTLVEAGCAVTVTLRTYRHGETVVPQAAPPCRMTGAWSASRARISSSAPRPVRISP